MTTTPPATAAAAVAAMGTHMEAVVVAVVAVVAVHSKGASEDGKGEGTGASLAPKLKSPSAIGSTTSCCSQSLS